MTSTSRVWLVTGASSGFGRAITEAALAAGDVVVAALVRAVLPGMRARGGGAIVQMSSFGGQVALPGFSAYCATKFALEGYSARAAAIRTALDADTTPLRLPLGADAVEGILAHLDAVRAELRTWEPVARDTALVAGWVPVPVPRRLGRRGWGLSRFGYGLLRRPGCRRAWSPSVVGNRPSAGPSRRSARVVDGQLNTRYLLLTSQVCHV